MTRAIAIISIILLAIGFANTGWLHAIDIRIADLQFNILRKIGPRPTANDVIVVGFDETTSDTIKEPFALWHPHIAKFLQAASSAGATVIGLDVILPDKSYDFLVPGYDQKLLTSILTARRTTPIILSLTVNPEGLTRPIYPAFLAAAGKDATGYALLPQDTDGAVRMFSEQISIDENELPTLVGQMARRLGKIVDKGLIDFASGEPFNFVPLQQVIGWYDADKTHELEQLFKGKAVLLGSTLKYEDRLTAPVHLVAWDSQATNSPGVLLHAQALRNVLNDGFIQPVQNLIPIAIAIAMAFLWLCTPAPIVAFVSIIFICIAYFLISLLTLSKGFEFQIVIPTLTGILAMGGRQLLEIALNLRLKKRLQSSFGGYVSPQVMQAIIKGSINPSMDGVKQFTCILFSDIRGYTTRSEQMSPEQTIKFINDYFEHIVPIIHEHGGTVNCFMGDGIMASFGVPQEMKSPCVAAFQASLAILDYLFQLNIELKQKGEQALEIGIGLHAGETVAGHIGAASRHDYSVIGDVVNVASRLEGVTKEIGYRLACSREVANHLGPSVNLISLGEYPIKGHTAVEVFGYNSMSI